uniref:Uncharacterized protein n=1 Tax=Peronospora matthiolae TaxID=2874970 RepID=A0AAV1VNQ3_9STRA
MLVSDSDIGVEVRLILSYHQAHSLNRTDGAVVKWCSAASALLIVTRWTEGLLLWRFQLGVESRYRDDEALVKVTTKLDHVLMHIRVCLADMVLLRVSSSRSEGSSNSS